MDNLPSNTILSHIEFAKNYNFEMQNEIPSQSGDPFVLVLFKYFHNTFTRCPRFSVLFM
jgi:hypothetical protein